jgi:hypothetical protein
LIAELKECPIKEKSCSLLQWGRDQLIAELLAGVLGATPQMWGFNARLDLSRSQQSFSVESTT